MHKLFLYKYTASATQCFLAHVTLGSSICCVSFTHVEIKICMDDIKKPNN